MIFCCISRHVKSSNKKSLSVGIKFILKILSIGTSLMDINFNSLRNVIIIQNWSTRMRPQLGTVFFKGCGPPRWAIYGQVSSLLIFEGFILFQQSIFFFSLCFLSLLKREIYLPLEGKMFPDGTTTPVLQLLYNIINILFGRFLYKNVIKLTVIFNNCHYLHAFEVDKKISLESIQKVTISIWCSLLYLIMTVCHI